MPDVTLLLFHAPPHVTDAPLTRLLGEARRLLVERQVALFRRAGATRVVLAAGRGVDAAGSAGEAGDVGSAPALPPLRPAPGRSFGDALATLVRDEGIDACVIMGDGAVPRLRAADVRRLVDTAGGGGRRALTNNRYSSDICAVSDAAALRGLPPLPSDNALPRWLEEVAAFEVRELPGRDRLGLDLDTPLDLALLALAPDGPAPLRRLAARDGIGIPRADGLRAVAADPRAELLVFGRSSSRTLAWLERHVRCRVRFLAEERGMRASSPLAIGGTEPRTHAPGLPTRRPRATIGRLLERDGPAALARVVADLADAAVLDTRVLLADRFGPDEAAWPDAEDRFASDLLLAGRVSDPWLRDLTASAAAAPVPILLGGHTLVGPGIPLLLRGVRRDGGSGAPGVRGRADALR